MTLPPLLSIILCNSDSADYTLACIESLTRHPPDGAYEIILVDNASHDDCVPRVRATYPEVQILIAPQRQGFSRNYNMGLRQARGAFVFVLNNDTLVDGATLQELIRVLERDPSYGMVGPRMIGGDGRIQTPCRRPLPNLMIYVLQQVLTDPGLPPGKLVQRVQQRRIERAPTGPAACISGAAMLVSRQALDAVGMLDEAYDFYYEDIEWCHRMQVQGYQVGYVAEARLIHFGGQSSARVKVWARQSEYLSAVHYFRQYRGARQLTMHIMWFATLLGFFLRGLGFIGLEAVRGRSGYARAYFYLWHWLIRRGPERGRSAESVSTGSNG